MGGRGASSPMATGTNASQRAMAGGAAAVQVQQVQRVRHGGVMSTTDTSGERFGPAVPGATHTMSEVANMTDAQFAKYVSGLTKGVSDSELDSHGLDSSNKYNTYVDGIRAADFQRFVYDAGLNGKPNIVSRQEFGRLDGDTIYRAVQSSGSIKSDTSDVRANRIISGEYFSTGRGYYGAGLYFGTDTSVKGYASSPRGHNSLVRAKLNGNARSVDVMQLSRMLSKESSSVRSALAGPQFGFKDEAYISIYAVRKGYNVIKCPTGLVILDRTALTVNEEAETF